MNISTKYKIENSVAKKTLGAIYLLGFDNAIKYAFEKAVVMLSKNPELMLSTEWLAWSKNLTFDARLTNEEIKSDELKTLSSFYRILAHKVYWYQRKNDEISTIKDFVQAA